MKTMISNLPRDLIEEILYRVPLKSMSAVRLTCKNWNALSKTHLAKLTAEAAKEGESPMIFLMDKDLYLTSGVTVNENPSTKLLGKLTCLNKKIEIVRVFHCEGLLLFTLWKTHDIVVWNPYLGQTRWIKPRYRHHRLPSFSYKYSLGYVDNKNKSCRSHKILRSLHLSYEIYDLDSGVWTTLDFPQHWDIRTNAFSLKGNIYWCAINTQEWPTRSYEELGHLFCFDFSRERFGSLMRLPFSYSYEEPVTLSCVREEKLAVLLTNVDRNPYKIEVWITTKVDDEAENISWSKFLTLDLIEHDPLIGYSSFFIDEEKKAVMCFDGSNHHTLSIFGSEARYSSRILDFGDKNRSVTYVCSYAPSLVQIKKPLGRGSKRKRRSKLEKHRDGEKRPCMLKSVTK